MKYTYAYKTSDGARHEEAIEAESREAVFAALREKGIKAIKVVAADGSKANGEIRGVRKRIVALAVVLAAALAGIAVFLLIPRGESIPADQHIAPALKRQMIVGDRERLDAARSTLFSLPAEAFLARFAEPGREFAAPECDWPKKDDFKAAFANQLMYADDEFTECIDLKRIVVWMKREMKAYLDAGGLVSGYIKELIKRQQTEIDLRKKAETKLNELLPRGLIQDRNRIEQAYNFMIQANAQLQGMGIYPIAVPDSLRNYQPQFNLSE